MAKLQLSVAFLLMICILCPNTSASDNSASSKTIQTKAHIVSACRTTRYPNLCIRCLSNYANSKANSTIDSPEKLAKVALTVSLYRAYKTRSYMLKIGKELQAIKPKEYQTVKDCMHDIDGSVAQLSQSIKELRRMEQVSVNDDFMWHISNVETWVSAALTDVSSCVDKFPGTRMSKLRATMKVKVLNVAQVTSNALALFHRYAARYRAANKP